jgi:3-oxoacyl-[acyl-carrier-protein] synthase-3
VSGRIKSVGVLGTGSYVPTRAVTNAELSGNDPSQAAWVEANLGIRERRIAAPGQTTSDLAACAGRRCLENADLNARDVDLVIVATATPDRLAPSTACIAQDKIGAVNAACFDLAAVCSGFVYAFVTGAQFVATGQCRNVLVIGADTFSRVTNWHDRSCVFFGDGAGAALLCPCPEPFGLLASELRADGRGKWNFTIPNEGDQTWMMNGQAVFDTATAVVPDAVATVLARSGLSVADVDLLLPHQPSIRVLERIAERLGIDFARVATNMHLYGNTAGASVGVVLDEANRSGRLAEGAVVALAAVGSGWTWGAAVLRWPGRGQTRAHAGQDRDVGFRTCA